MVEWVLRGREVRPAAPEVEMDSAYCVRCQRDDLPKSLLCTSRPDSTPITDNGADRDPSLVARYEGRCIRCCAHNHG